MVEVNSTLWNFTLQCTSLIFYQCYIPGTWDMRYFLSSPELEACMKHHWCDIVTKYLQLGPRSWGQVRPPGNKFIFWLHSLPLCLYCKYWRIVTSHLENMVNQQTTIIRRRRLSIIQSLNDVSSINFSDTNLCQLYKIVDPWSYCRSLIKT